MTLPLFVSEVFGPVLQGEGPALGQACAFLRLGYCNLACSWCDTPYTWDWTGQNGLAYDARQEIAARQPLELVDQLTAYGVPLVVVSGGEPLLQHRALGPLLELLRERKIAVDIETNGTVAPSFACDLARRYVVSPKLMSSGNGQRRYNPAALDWMVWSWRAVFKFVVTAPADLDEVDEIVVRHKIERDKVFIMPEGRSQEDVLAGLRTMAAPVIARGWTLTPRLHTLLWGDVRAR